MLLCNKCGHLLTNEFSFCTECGQKSPLSAEPVAPLARRGPPVLPFAPLPPYTPLAEVSSVRRARRGPGFWLGLVAGLLFLAGMPLLAYLAAYRERQPAPDNTLRHIPTDTPHAPIVPSVAPVTENRTTSPETHRLPNRGTVPLEPATSVTAGLDASSSAASYRGEESGHYYSYGPELAFDDDLGTAWAEGRADDNGVGEWLEYDFGQMVTLKAIKIAPGHFKNEETWLRNSALSSATLVFSDGDSEEIEFADRMTVQRFTCDGIRTSSVRLVITGVYRGHKTNVTAISEISFEYR